MSGYPSSSTVTNLLFKISPCVTSLRQYMRDCVLPEMGYEANDEILPPRGHVSHANNLVIRPESWRQFENIFGIDESVWDSMKSCLNEWIPDERLGSGSRQTFTVPVPQQGVFGAGRRATFQCVLDARPTEIERLTPWVDSFPLATVQRVLRLAIPELSRWTFRPRDAKRNGYDPDCDKFSYFTWSMDQGRPGPRIDPVQLAASQSQRMLVAVQPPWILTERDLQQFADCRQVPFFENPDFQRYTEFHHSTERLWAKIWDTCAREGIHYFVLTSYTHWVFGVFSPGYNNAFTTSVESFNAHSPTIVEMLGFWTLSAMGFKGGYKPPNLPEPFRRGPIRVGRPRQRCEVPEPDEYGSDSEWSGSELPSDKNSVSDCPSFGSFTNGEAVYETGIYGPDGKRDFPALMQWIRACLAQASRNRAYLDPENPVEYKDQLADWPFVVSIFQNPLEPMRAGGGPAHVGDWLI